MPRPDESGPRGFGPPPRDYLHDPLQLGITIVGTTAVFGGIGWWIDARLHTFPILMALGAAAGLFGIIYVIYMRLKEVDRKQRNGDGEVPSSREGTP